MHVFTTHTNGPAQPPQSTYPPQPSVVGPHCESSVLHGSATGTHPGRSCEASAPAPPASGGFVDGAASVDDGEQAPQSSSPPHLSAARPHATPSSPHVFGAHASPPSSLATFAFAGGSPSVPPLDPLHPSAAIPTAAPTQVQAIGPS